MFRRALHRLMNMVTVQGNSLSYCPWNVTLLGGYDHEENERLMRSLEERPWKTWGLNEII